jgi:hypothetical protein
VSATRFLSFARPQAEDTLVNVWRLDGKEAEVKKAEVAFAAPSSPVHAAVTSVSAADHLRVLVIDDKAGLALFEVDGGAAQAAKPLEPAGSIRISTGDVPSQSVAILGAEFAHSASGSQVVVARGAALAPVFETLVRGIGGRNG